ncbi:MAG: guanylate kinase [Clostridiales bacterium]|nr:guanylate kinase [Clostridiales bacterium]MDY2834918.1 guanylate kinase [Candidatus Aphodomonas sp.]
MKKPMMLVLSGPSGVGKGTLGKRLIEEEGFGFSVSCTTRGPRPGEKHGVDYLFITREEFLSRRAANGFLETATVHDEFYGTPREPAERAMAEGRDFLLDIDPQGGVQVMESVPEAVSVFLLPPSWAALEARLRGRGTETEEKIQKRLHNARQEVKYLPRYDYCIVNDDLDEAWRELRGIVRAERLSTKRFLPELD